MPVILFTFAPTTPTTEEEAALKSLLGLVKTGFKMHGYDGVNMSASTTKMTEKMMKVKCKHIFQSKSILLGRVVLQNLMHHLKNGPWSSGYGRRLTFQRLRVQIQAMYTG